MKPFEQSAPVAMVMPHGASVRLEWDSVEAAHNAKPGPLFATLPPASAAGEREALDPEGIERLETELFFRRRRLRETHTHPENIEDPGFFDGFHAAEAYYGITTKKPS